MKIQEAKLFASVLAVVKQQTKKLTEDVLTKVDIIEGPEGSKGDAGNKGDKGDTGARGARGSRGEKGLQGETGLQGEQGTIGGRGPQGEQGLQGEPGEKGEPGLLGEQGEIGPNGLQGLQGARGDRGTSGRDGKDGSDGVKGDKGDKGPKGDKGDSGQQGSKGEQGLKGDKGPKGDKGDKGSQGKIGPKGVKGVRGDKGTSGKDGKNGSDTEVTRLKKDFDTYKRIVGQQLESLGGGGSVNILDMDDVVFNYPSQLANNDILIFDQNVQKFTALNIVDIINNIKIELEMQYDKLIDEQISGPTTYTYIGEATPGGQAANSVWRIKRVGEYANNLTEILWANDSDAFDKVWDDRITYTYNK